MMAEKKHDPNEWKRWLWICNRCYVIRTPLRGYCPRCGSPEFSLRSRSEMSGQQLHLF